MNPCKTFDIMFDQEWKENAVSILNPESRRRRADYLHEKSRQIDFGLHRLFSFPFFIHWRTFNFSVQQWREIKKFEVIKLANKLNISSWILSLLLTLKLSAPIKMPWRGAQRSNGREGSAATYRKLSSLSQQLDNHSLTNFTLIHARKKHGWMNFEESALSIINISCLIMQRFDYYRFIIMLSAPSPMPPTTTLSLPAAAYLPTSEWSDSRAERERKRVSSLADIDFF